MFKLYLNFFYEILNTFNCLLFLYRHQFIFIADDRLLCAMYTNMELEFNKLLVRKTTRNNFAS